jgi:hypothetical protein
MQTSSLFSNWTKIAGLLLMGGALAWLIKLYVIVSSNGRIIDTGASAVSMNIGLVLLFIGSTGIGNRISINQKLLLRILAILVSPVVIFGSFLLFAALANALVTNSRVWYAQQEAPIAFAVVFYLAIGYLLFKSRKPVVQ